MYILFDIGGTKTRIATSSDLKRFSEPLVFPTKQNFSDAITMLVSEIRKISKGKKIQACAGGLAGPLNAKKTMTVNAPNLPNWNKKPFVSQLQKKLKVPVYLENDCVMAALGEAHFGAGKGGKIVAYMTVSTGVGGARIVKGHRDESCFGFEPGWQVIDPSNKLAKNGALEECVSGSALEKRFGKKPYEIHSKKIWNEIARLLAIGLNNSIVHWSPDVFVLGGSLIVNDTGIPFDLIMKHLKKIMIRFPRFPKITKAKLGDFGGLYGAMKYLEMRNLQN